MVVGCCSVRRGEILVAVATLGSLVMAVIGQRVVRSAFYPRTLYSGLRAHVVIRKESLVLCCCPHVASEPVLLWHGPLCWQRMVCVRVS